MKLRWFALGSLCLNLAMGFIFFKARAPSVEPTQGVSIPARNPREVTHVTVDTLKTTNVVAGRKKLVEQDWRSVEATDYKEYIQRLRAIGCPEETIQDIIIADLNRLYAGRWKAVVAPNGVKYWEPWDYQVNYYDRETRRQRDELDFERESVVRELLGISFKEAMRKQEIRWMGQDRDDQMLNFLPLAKRQAVQAEVEKERMLSFKITSPLLMAPNVQEPMTSEQQAELAKIKADSKKAIQAILTPEEYNQYIMRVSPMANSLRSQLIGFNPSKEEYDAIFLSRAAYEERAANGTPQNPTEQANQLRTALGEARYADYVRSSDYVYRDLVRFTQQEKLSPALAQSVYDFKRSVEADAMKVRTNPELSPEARMAALQVLRVGAEKRLEETMGNASYGKYRSRASWLQMIR